MNCELMLTYDTPALRQTGSRNLIGPKTLPTIWGTYLKLVTKYQISAINCCWEKCAYMFNVYKNQLSRQTGSRNLMGPKTLHTWTPHTLKQHCSPSYIWGIALKQHCSPSYIWGIALKQHCSPCYIWGIASVIYEG